MPPENKPSSGNQKQKITIAAVVLVLGVVAWQGLKLFGGDSGSAPLSPVATAPARSMTAGQPASASGGAVAPQAAAEALAPKQVPVQVNAEILKVQLDTQAKYIAALNELEMLKVQKEIADTKEAITSATLATATAEKSITDLLTVQQLPNAVANAYSPSPVGVSEGGSSGTTNIPVAPKPVAPPPAQSPFTLMSVSFKAERWSAVLTAQSKFYNVTVGQVLPLDSSVVTEIDRNGVTVMLKDKQTKRITMIPEL
jgi:hypothetical protein